jgi:predicted transcriptional regulator
MTNADLSNGQRFLDAFNQIERILRSRASPEKDRVGFSQLVRASDDLIQGQRDLLLDYAVLRNAIVHTKTEAGRLIADPRSDVVARIEEQVDLIERPPKVLETLRLAPPKILKWDDSVFQFFQQVRLPFDFSQAPVVSRSGDIDLITTNAVARWVAASWEQAQGAALTETSVEQVLHFSEKGDRVEIRSRGLKVVDAWRLFSGASGEPPSAILLTHSGAATEKPLGLCVRADLPAMLKVLGV